jgi:hypothetical protein
LKEVVVTQNAEIPDDVQNTPAGPDGNGFVVLGAVSQFIVGLDGKIYVRKDGRIVVAPESEED